MLLVTVGGETFEVRESELMAFWAEIVMADGAEDAEMSVRYAPE